jgi:DNA-binding protein HU-beta
MTGGESAPCFRFFRPKLDCIRRSSLHRALTSPIWQDYKPSEGSRRLELLAMRRHYWLFAWWHQKFHNPEGIYVNKSELIDAIASNAEISKAAAGRALDATVSAVKQALKTQDSVTLVGFGTFYLGERAARTGRNPRTGKSIKIHAAKVPKFRPGKGLRDAVN